LAGRVSWPKFLGQLLRPLRTVKIERKNIITNEQTHTPLEATREVQADLIRRALAAWFGSVDNVVPPEDVGLHVVARWPASGVSLQVMAPSPGRCGL